jgi:hypothetical protein
MFDHNPFREVVEEINKQRTSFVFKTKKEVIAHLNLVPSEDGDGYRHASGNGGKYSEEDVEHMLYHGTLKPTEPRPEPEHTRHIPTKEQINRVLQQKERQNAQR